jgi:hypothetical protein
MRKGIIAQLALDIAEWSASLSDLFISVKEPLLEAGWAV